MCVTSYDCIYQPPSRSSMGLFQIIELIIMGVCGILCAGNLIEYFKNNSGVTTLLILSIVGDILVVAGLVLVFFGLFCPFNSNNLRTGIICFVVGAIVFAVAILLSVVSSSNGKTSISQIFQFILLVFLAYILWIQAGRV